MDKTEREREQEARAKKANGWHASFPAAYLLSLLAYCLDKKSPCLVYPLATGGSLEDRLSQGRLLSPSARWPTGDAPHEPRQADSPH